VRTSAIEAGQFAAGWDQAFHGLHIGARTPSWRSSLVTRLATGIPSPERPTRSAAEAASCGRWAGPTSASRCTPRPCWHPACAACSRWRHTSTVSAQPCLVFAIPYPSGAVTTHTPGTRIQLTSLQHCQANDGSSHSSDRAKHDRACPRAWQHTQSHHQRPHQRSSVPVSTPC